MFFLSLLDHTLRLPPNLLNLPLDEAIKRELERLFLDKVIRDLGLCVSVYDIRGIRGGYILPNEGSSTYTAMFRMIMFRPFKGEIIIGRIKDSLLSGVQVSIGFYDDIHVPPHLLPSPCRFDAGGDDRERGRWIWEYEGGDYPIDIDDEVRFVVIELNYPTIPLENTMDSKPFSPMVVVGSFEDEGLGPVCWW